MTAVAVPIDRRSGCLVSSAVTLWLAQGLTVIGGLVRGKVGAVELGPEGIGLVSQLNFLSMFLSGVAALGISNGCIKLLAEAKATGDEQRQRQVRSVLLVYPLLAGSVLALLTGAGASILGPLFLGSASHNVAIVVAAVSVPLSMAAGSFAVALQGESSMRRLAGGNAVIAVANTVIVVTCIFAFGLAGAIAAVALTSLAALVVFAAREPQLFRGLSVRPAALFDRGLLRAVYALGLASIVLSLASGALDLGLRTLIVHRLGLEANGLYQPVSLLSSQLFLALGVGVAIYLFPRLTGLYASGRATDAHAEVNAALRLLLAAVAPAVVLLVAFAESVLQLAFSDQFTGAGPTLHYQLLGEVFRAFSWTVGAILLPLGLVRQWLGLGLLTLAVQAALVPALLPVLGLPGMAVGYCAAWLLSAALSFLVARRRAGFALERSSVVYACVAVVAAATTVALARGAPGLVGEIAIPLAAVMTVGALGAAALRPLSLGFGVRRR